ncbi:hypothetical protein AYL99_07868 [Fonsecaea erecta]|uniref:RRM domain-containing protein n=1 Tax=Fonsecaea erecta TaxID=1367422 RepID=A0A178ZCC1_9EURO|nr:hypothetical protein AYL99_07868 [Fonsecaea erecta]OAP57131.1 hypothetical protein AYL99_07868 [Fonsecaea erecta]
MSKVKSKSAPAVGPKAGVLSKVKGAAVAKPSQTVKAKSKVIAKEVAAKEQKKDKKNKNVPVKEPTPEPESSSEEESEDSASSEEESESEDGAKPNRANGVKIQEEDDSEGDSSDESDSDASSEDEAPKVNGSAAKAKPAADTSESEEEDDEESSEEESDEEEKLAAKGTKKGGAAVKKEEDESEESSDESESEEEAAAPKATKTTKTKDVKPAGAKAAAESSDEDADDSDESSDESEESEESADEEVEAKPAKRKAEDVEAPAAKKTKVEEDGSRGSNLFVGNLSWNVDEEWLKSEFEEFGELSGVRLITQREDGRSKGYGYVEFVNAADAAKAHAAKQGYELDGRVMNVDFANKKPDAGEKQEKRRQSYGDQLSEPSDTLFLGNLSFEITEDDVYNIFAPYGTPTGVRIPTDRETGNVKGYGYVTFATLDEAKSALEGAQGSYVKNRPLRVDYAQPRQQNVDAPARGGGFGGFGGRGGRGGPRGGRGGSRDFGGRGGRGGRGGPRGGARGGRGGTTNRGGFGDFSGKKTTF